MQTLHLVGLTAGLDGLVFSTRRGATSGSYVVPLDARLARHIAEAEQLRRAGDRRPAPPPSVGPPSALSPRQIQDRIRAGWSLDDVAAEAGVDLDWVTRFAAPVHAEMRRIVGRGRELVYAKPRVGPSSLPLDVSVRRNIGGRGVHLIDDDFDDGWSAFQLDKHVWAIRFSYTSRGRPQAAEWQLDLETEELTSRNRLGTQLGHVASPADRPPRPPTESLPGL